MLSSTTYAKLRPTEPYTSLIALFNKRLASPTNYFWSSLLFTHKNPKAHLNNKFDGTWNFDEKMGFTFFLQRQAITAKKVS